MARTCLSIILAAGEGSRMKSAMPKVLHPVGGLALVSHVLQAAMDAGGDSHALVTGRQAEKVEAEARKRAEKISVHLQAERLGTAHAVLSAREEIARGHDDILVLFGDTPLLKPATLKRMRRALETGADIAVLGFHTSEPDGYGRLIERNGELVAIREHRDASEEELKVGFCNGGIMAFSGAHALELMDAVGNDNAKGEYYLTDCVEIARERGLKVVAIEGDEREVHGVNDRYDLARAEAIWQQERRDALLRSGVTMVDPASVFLSHDTQIAADVFIEPNVFFGPGVEVLEGAVIRAFSHIEGARIAGGATVGPFARLRPGTRLGEGSKVGNFCETKNAEVADGAKINHLSYIGDARVGAGANIGAGTITCNYDGKNKHFTDIGAGAFIGTDSALVAPVTIGEGAYVASGSVITMDVPADAMAVARGRQVNKEGHARVIRERNEAFAASRRK